MRLVKVLMQLHMAVLGFWKLSELNFLSVEVNFT